MNSRILLTWSGALQKHAIKPVQQYAYTTSKNTSDSALIIDAMDLLYTRKFDDAGWAHLRIFSSRLPKRQPDFDSRLFGVALRPGRNLAEQEQALGSYAT